MINECINEIKRTLKESAPPQTLEEIKRKNKILNSNNPNFISLGIKVADLEKIARKIHEKYNCSYEDDVLIFKQLTKSNIHEEKFISFLLLNRSKKDFNESTIDLFHDELMNYCDCWAICDSSMIKVVGPFLGKKGNEKLSIKIIEKWARSEIMWIRRASMVILLKVIMIRKDFNEEDVFKMVEKMLPDDDGYIQKGVGWLLKTCSRYKPEIIKDYLIKNKSTLPRLILRYASEKLTKEQRAEVLKK